MFKRTKFHKKIKLTYITSALVIGFGMIIAFPWIPVHKSAKSNYYIATLNGTSIGSAKSEKVIEQALKNARLKIDSASGSMTYIEQNLDIKNEERVVGKHLSEAKLEQKMYKVLKATKEKTTDVKPAYVVNIDDYTVTLGSEQEVVELLNAVKSKYDVNNEFQIDMVEGEDNVYSYLTTETVKSQKQPKDKNVVMASQNGEAEQSGEVQKAEDTVQPQQDGIKDISFAENIQVLETYTDSDKITDLQSAIDDVTKDKAENQTYIVGEGDCLSSIAEKYNLYMAEILGMNPGLTADSVIGIGDVLTVTVPKPELSVIVKQETTYQEVYNADVQYIYNDSKYTTEQTVINEGAQGVRNVTAMVTLQDGSEISREILSQNVINEAVPRVVEVGTQVPPTFIKPIAGGRMSSPFGMRWGKLHKGIDWACPTGTAVNASCGGRIVTAGWVRGYGYCVEIAHSDGKHTRYGHLSNILVSVGQSVNQGDKIALSGNTGDSTGPHLHFEIIVNGAQTNPVSYLN